MTPQARRSRQDGVTLRRDTLTVTIPAGETVRIESQGDFVPDVGNTEVLVPLAKVVRALGGTVTYDANKKTVHVTFPPGWAGPGGGVPKVPKRGRPRRAPGGQPEMIPSAARPSSGGARD